MKPQTATSLLWATIALNIIDMVLHIAINQPEILRITGNIIVIATSVLCLFRQQNLAPLLGVSLLLYLILNGVFILLNGIGTAGLAFIAITTLLGVLSLLSDKKSRTS